MEEMIQRIQSIYLLSAAVLMVLMVFMPFAEIAGTDGSLYILGSGGLSLVEEDSLTPLTQAVPLRFLIVILALLLIVNIFLFRNRRLQMRVCVYAIILEFGLIGLGYYYFFLAFREIHVGGHAFRVTVILPVLCIILIYLAYRGIRKDDILVRSINKIR